MALAELDEVKILMAVNQEGPQSQKCSTDLLIQSDVGCVPCFPGIDPLRIVAMRCLESKTQEIWHVIAQHRQQHRKASAVLLVIGRVHL